MEEVVQHALSVAVFGGQVEVLLRLVLILLLIDPMVTHHPSHIQRLRIQFLRLFPQNLQHHVLLWRFQADSIVSLQTQKVPAT